MDPENYLHLKLLEGEGYRVEFKENLASNLDREIVAFANAAGGEIYLGVNDAGEVKGIEITNSLLSQIHDIARNCDPSISISLKKYSKEKVLAIVIDEGPNKPYKCREGFFLRVGPSSQKLKRDEIVQFINDVGKIHFDEACNPYFSYPNDLSAEAVKNYLNQCNIYSSSSIEDILISLNLAEEEKNKLKITNAAVLFFAKNPQKFFREAYITAIRYQSEDRHNIIDKKDFTGSLISQIEESLAFVIRHINVAAGFMPTVSGAREDIYDYPPIAIREAIVNAVTHRDYLYDNSHTYIHIFPDHIDIENPGGLYHGLKIDDLGHRSVRRNRLIADLLHRARYIERIGSGFDRMRIALSENSNPPLSVTANNFFNLRFSKRVMVIQGFDIRKLSSRQLTIYSYLIKKQVVTKNEIATLLNSSNDTAVRELKEMIQLGLIEKQGIGKATRYVLNDTND